MKIFEFPNGDELHRFDQNIVLELHGKRRVMSTAPYNGGYRTDLSYVLNHDGNPGTGCSVVMKGATYREHMLNTIKEIGLDPKSSTGMETAVRMETAAIHTESYEQMSVTAIVTAGLEVNGGRVGDPATWAQDGDVAEEHRLGTINILLCLNVDLSEGAMARALVTSTEAKTAALQELAVQSRYSRGLATGSGTDGTAIIADRESACYLTDTGKHSKLGELIGKSVKKAVKQALYQQSGLGPAKQHDVFRRLSRFGLSRMGLYSKCKEIYPEQAPGRPEFEAVAEVLGKESRMVSYASFLAHCIDQMDWELFSVAESLQSADELLRSLGGKGLTGKSEIATADQAVEEIMEAFERTFIEKVVEKC